MRRTLLLLVLGVLYGCDSSIPPIVAPTGPSSLPPSAPSLGTTVTGTVIDSVSKQVLVSANVQWAGLAEAWGDRGHGVFTNSHGVFTLPVSEHGRSGR
jgi:hypothetical protein